jgi:hypothetical protein
MMVAPTSTDDERAAVPRRDMIEAAATEISYMLVFLSKLPESLGYGEEH